jgi:DNA polymerase III subunit delta'
VSRKQTVLEGLSRAEAEGRLYHAYILSGTEGASKVDAVERFAARIFAKSAAGLFGGGGDEASALARIRGSGHPDFLRLNAVNGVLGVDEVRELPRMLAYPPLEAPRRIVLLPEAAALNAQAANAILKILEEPPAHTMFFLLVGDPSELLQTIQSRCQVLRFAPLADQELLATFAETPAEAGTLLAWAEGSSDRARFLLGLEGGLELRKAACGALLDLWEAAPRIPSAVVQWLEGVESEDDCKVVVDSWELMLRDLLFTASGSGPEGLRFSDLHGRLSRLTARGGDGILRTASGKTKAINRFRVYRELNGNLRLDLVALLAELQISW